MFLTTAVIGSELTHEFKNPSFSGQGYSNHVLALEQLRYQREKEIQEKKEAAAAKLARELEQTTLNKFINNVHQFHYFLSLVSLFYWILVQVFLDLLQYLASKC